MIRAAARDDLASLMAIWNPLIRGTMVTFNSVEKSLTDMEKILTEKSAARQPFLLAEINGQAVGFATYGQFRSGIGYARSMEHTIILGDHARGRGVGRALMTAIEDHARTAGAHCMIAGVSAGNPEGRGFHAALGYLVTAVIPEVGFKFGRWWDLVLMQKFLT